MVQNQRGLQRYDVVEDENAEVRNRNKVGTGRCCDVVVILACCVRRLRLVDVKAAENTQPQQQNTRERLRVFISCEYYLLHYTLRY